MRGAVKAHGGLPAPLVGVKFAVLGRGKGGVQGRCPPGGGRGHGPPEWRRRAVPGGWVAPALRVALEIRALGGRGARPRDEPTPPPPPLVLGRPPPPPPPGRGEGRREGHRGGGATS